MRYETDCPLLIPKARERLREFRARRECQLRRQIKISEAHLRTGSEDLGRVDKDNALPEQGSKISEELMELAVSLVADGVREFAKALLVSQDRLGIHAVLLRAYTADLVNEIREMLNKTLLFKSDPLLPWAQDPITMQAIQTCEEVIAERREQGDSWEYCGVSTGKPTWAAIVHQWEAYKTINKIASGERERIPESVLRGFLADHYRITPDDVDGEQIRRAGAELCCHYGPVLMIPLEREANRSVKAELNPEGDARFWKEREDEFTKHDTPGNSKLSAVWCSMGEDWSFCSGPRTTAAILRAEQTFKALAREAAKGLIGSQSAEPYLDWLEALRCARDRSTGRRLYAKVSATGTTVLGEMELERMKRSSEPVARSGLIEFIVQAEAEDDVGRSAASEVSPVAHAEMRMFWDTTTEIIEDLFAVSANLCLEIRSRIPDVRETIDGGTVVGTTFGGKLNRLRLESGWSYDELAKATGIDKKLIINHLKKGKRAHPSTLALYATAFTKKLGRTITGADLAG